MDKIEKNNKTILFAFGSVILAVIIIIVAGLIILKPKEDIFQGQAEANYTRISGLLPGRIARLYVKEGDLVKAGDTLASIFSAQAEAKLNQVQAQEQTAAARENLVDAGARKQEIYALNQVYQKAIAAENISAKTYDRMENLFSQGVVSEQKRDEAKAGYLVAVANSKAAKAQYDIAVEGARTQDKQMAKSTVMAAQAGIEQVNAVLADSHLTAPIDGEITQVYPQYGELVGAGSPIMSLQNNLDMWVSFNIREESLKYFKMNQKKHVRIPALNDEKAEMEIYYIKNLGSYAIWRATKATGSYDARTFEVRMRPTHNIDGFRPGMTVIYDKKE